MKDEYKTKTQLIEELEALRKQVIELKKMETKRKRAEQTLKESESRFRGIIESSKDGIIFFDGKTQKILFGNNAMAELLGCSMEDLVGRSISSLHPSQERESIEQEFQKHVSGELLVSAGIPVLRGDGSVFYADIGSSLITLDGISYFSAFFRDIAERKRAEEALRESEARYRLISENTADVVWSLNPATEKFTYVSPSVQKLRGYTPEEVMAQPISAAFTPASLKHVRDLLAVRMPQILALGSGTLSYTDEVDQQRKDGSIVSTEVTTTYLRNERGEIEIVGVTRDITERKRAEAQIECNLRETRVRFEVSQALAGKETEDEVLDALIQHAGLYPQPHVSIFTFDRTGGELAVILRRLHLPEIGRVSPVPLGTRFRASRLTVINFYSADQPFVSNDVSADERVDPDTREILRQNGETSLAVFPLTAGNEWLGYIGVTAESAGYFDEEKQHLYQTLAEQGAVALRAARLRETIRESQQRLSLLVQQSPLAVIEWNTDLQAVLWNPAAERIFGYTREEALGRPAAGLIIPEQARPLAAQVWQDLLAQKGDTHKINDNLTKDGRRIICEWFNSALVGADGMVIGIVSLVEDITERKETEEALRESEERYRVLAEASHDMIFMIGRDDRVQYVNTFAARQFNATPEQVIGKPRSDLFPPDIAKRQGQSLRRVFDSGQPLFNESFLRFGEREMWISNWLVPLCDESGAVTAVMGISRDITERKRAENALLTIRKAIDSSGDAIGMSDPQGHHFYQNKAFTDLFEYTVEELEAAGGGPSAYADQTVARVVFDTIMSGGSWNGELEMISKSGRKFPVLLRADAIKDDFGRIVGLIGVHIDITERKRAEEALRQSEQRKTILNQIATIFLTLSDEEMYGEVLAVVLQAMKSKFGIFGYIGDNGDLIIPSLTRGIWSECQVPGKSIVFPSDSWGESLWGRAIREKKAFYSDGPFRTPEGHVHIDNFLTVPIVFGKETIGSLSVANKYGGYTEEDKELQENIANFISPILNARLQRDRQEWERKRAEKVVLESEEKFRMVSDFTYDWEYWVKPDGNFVYISPSCERITGYRVDEFFDNPKLLTSIVHPDDYDRVSQYISEVLKPGCEICSYDFRIITRGGEERWISHHCQPVYSQDGIWLGRRGSSRDITERKRAEQERNRLFEQVHLGRERLQELSRRLVELQEVYRRDLSRELHDRVGQNLTVLSLNLSIIQSQLSPESITKISSRIEDSQKLLEETIERIRDVMAELRPPVLDDYGLMATLRWYGERFSKQTNMATIIQGEELTPRLPVPVEIILFRIAQEALTNVAKHAHAKTVTVRLEELEDSVRLTIADDGVGFDYQTHHQQGAKPEWGLINMRERAQTIGGKLDVEIALGKGTTIVVEVLRK